MPARPIDVGPHAVERTLIERPLEFADESRVEPQAFDRLDLRIARRRFGARGVAEAAELHVESGHDGLETDVQIAQVDLVAVRPAALLEVERAGAERARTGGVGRKSAELDVLNRGRDVEARRATLDADLQPVRDIGVIGIAATGIGLEVVPGLDSGPVAQEPPRLRGRRRRGGSAGVCAPSGTEQQPRCDDQSEADRRRMPAHVGNGHVAL